MVVECWCSRTDDPLYQLPYSSDRDTQFDAGSPLDQMPYIGGLCPADLCDHSLYRTHSHHVCRDQLAPLDLYHTDQTNASRRFRRPGHAHEAHVAQRGYALMGCPLVLYGTAFEQCQCVLVLRDLSPGHYLSYPDPPCPFRLDALASSGDGQGTRWPSRAACQ